MLIVPSWNLGVVAPPRVAVSGASDRLCIAVIVPFLRIRAVAIPDSRTMAGTSRLTVKPDGPFAYTNICDAICVPKTGDATLPAGAAGVMVLGGAVALAIGARLRRRRQE
jgi:hypothetical protein